jgi:hypothetical protein
MGSSERSHLPAPPNVQDGLTHKSCERTNLQPPPHYLPLGNPKPPAQSNARAANARKTTARPIFCTVPSTSAPDPRARSKAHRGSDCLVADLGEIRSCDQVESDVLAVEEVCRELMRAELIRDRTGFGCPVTGLATTGTSSTEPSS